MNRNKINLLSQGKITEVKSLNNQKNILSDLYLWIHQTNNITAYTLILSYLIDLETLEIHESANFLLSMPLCSYKDAYSLGLFHIKRILTLNPNDIDVY